jgi:hypothetical protein
MLVAPAAAAAFAEHERFIGAHIRDNLVGLGVADQRAAGNLDYEILAVLAGTAGTLAVTPGRCGILALITEVHQSGHMVIDLQDNGTALAAIAAVGTAVGDVLFAVERHNTVAAVTGLDGDAGLIDKRSCDGNAPPVFLIGFPDVYIPKHERTMLSDENI